MEMIANCFRCGRSAFATLKIEAAIGATQLKIKGDTRETGICASCMIALADWVKRPGLYPKAQDAVSSNALSSPSQADLAPHAL
jgi:hypothetical protein